LLGCVTILVGKDYHAWGLLNQRTAWAILSVVILAVGIVSYVGFSNQWFAHQNIKGVATASHQSSEIHGFTFSYSPASAEAGKPLLFLATILGGAPPFTYHWSFGDGSTGAGNPVNHTFPVSIYNNTCTVLPRAYPVLASGLAVSGDASGYVPPADSGNRDDGYYNVTLAVNDSNGKTFELTQQIHIADALQGFYWSYYLPGIPGQPARFHASVLGDFPPITYFWSFGDGTNATGDWAVHTFVKFGLLHLTLAVSDSIGRTWRDCKDFTIPDPAAGDYTIYSSPGSRTVEVGQTAIFHIVLNSYGYAGTIHLATRFDQNLKLDQTELYLCRNCTKTVSVSIYGQPPYGGVLSQSELYQMDIWSWTDTGIVHITWLNLTINPADANQ
jgi:hypothetical protein